MEAASPAARRVSLDELPDHLLGYIISLAGWDQGPSLTLVSRRWLCLFFAEPELWHEIEVVGRHEGETEANQRLRLSHQAAQLRRIEAPVHCFRWRQAHLDNATDAAYLACCLSALQHKQLAELRLDAPLGLQGGVSAALQQLASISSLALERCTSLEVCAALQAVGCRLRSLQVQLFDLSPAALSSITQLAQLTALGIWAGAWPDLGTLTRLSQLKQLVLHDGGYSGQEGMHAPEPASFPSGLERFDYSSNSRTFQLGDFELSLCMLWHGMLLPMPFHCGEHEIPLPTLRLGCPRPLASLPLLLDALRPSSAAACTFQCLEVDGCLLSPAALAGCSQLRQLRAAALIDTMTFDGSSLEASLAALLQQATRLSSLAIASSSYAADFEDFVLLGAVPACLASYCGLTSLVLRGQHLTDLPAGEYLAGLTHLDISGNEFAHVPAALSVATGLTSLLVNSNSQLSFCEAGADTLLALTRLCCLEMFGIKAADSAQLDRLRQLPSIVIKCSFSGIYSF